MDDSREADLALNRPAYATDPPWGSGQRHSGGPPACSAARDRRATGAYHYRWYAANRTREFTQSPGVWQRIQSSHCVPRRACCPVDREV